MKLMLEGYEVEIKARKVWGDKMKVNKEDTLDFLFDLKFVYDYASKYWDSIDSDKFMRDRYFEESQAVRVVLSSNEYFD